MTMPLQTVHVHVDHLVIPYADFDVDGLVAALRRQVQAAATTGNFPAGPRHRVPSLRLRLTRPGDGGAVGTAVGTILGGFP